MSTYYTYYLGFVKDKQLYPLGPFDYSGKYFSVVSNSRSFASDLWQVFDLISDSDITLTKELKDALCSDWEVDSQEEYFKGLRYLPIKKLPTYLNPIEDGYFLISDVNKYLENAYDDFDIFYEKMTPLEYAERSHNEIVFGLSQVEKDCEGNEYKEHSCKDYMYFRYRKNIGLAAEVEKINHAHQLLTNTIYITDEIEYVVICSIS